MHFRCNVLSTALEAKQANNFFFEETDKIIVPFLYLILWFFVIFLGSVSNETLVFNQIQTQGN